MIFARKPKSPHACIVCPVEVRGLFATAYNAVHAYGRGDYERLRRKMVELERELAELQPVVDAHFEATSK